MSARHALLPSGFYDMLTPQATREAELRARIMQCFERFGYQRVKPPLVEFEDNLLRGSGDDLSRQTFRVMDPLSQRMMGVRADITMQIGRIALTRMQDAPKPLRLCYSGTVLNTSGTALAPERQHVQAGIELIGVDSVQADAEAILIGIRALEAVELESISVDLNIPSFIPTLLQELNISPSQAADIALAMAHKDQTALMTLPAEAQSLLSPLTQLFGGAAKVMPALAQQPLPQSVQPLLLRLQQLIELVQQKAPNISLNVDVTENRGFDYHEGVSFAFFAANIDGEVGRGGRYKVAFDETTPAMGVTLYVSQLLEQLPAPTAQKRILVSTSADEATIQQLQADGWVTLLSLSDGDADEETLKAAAKDCDCSHIWYKGGVISR